MQINTVEGRAAWKAHMAVLLSGADTYIYIYMYIYMYIYIYM